MPALVKSRVGSLAGTSEEECTSRCPFWTKKSRNIRRIWLPVSIDIGAVSSTKSNTKTAVVEVGTEFCILSAASRDSLRGRNQSSQHGQAPLTFNLAVAFLSSTFTSKLVSRSVSELVYPSQ